MIKNLFFPERINDYFLFEKKIVGIHIAPNTIYATCLKAKGGKTTITQIIAEQIEPTTKDLSAAKSTALALKKCLQKAGSFDEVVSSIDSSYVTFKELTLPIIGEEKIKMVLGFELEPHLPFALDQAALDFIVTNVDEKKKTSTIMVAAVQKKYLEAHNDLFIKNGFPAPTVTTDIIATFGFYKQCGGKVENNTALIICDSHQTHIGYIQASNISKVRTLAFSLQNDANEDGWNKAAFTISSFAQEESVKKVIFIGDIPYGSLSKAKDLFGVPCEQFKLEKNLKSAGINVTATHSSAHINVLSCATAYPSILTQDFNLQLDDVTPQEQARFTVQMFTAGVLSLTILCSLSVHTFLQVRKLSSIADKAKTKIIKDLKKNMPNLKGSSLKEVVRKAKKELKKEENTWLPFSNKTRQSFLKYLSDITTKVDREVLGLNMKKMIITKSNITLEGSVRNFDAISEFEKQLKDTKLFVVVPELQLTTFNETLELIDKGGMS